MISETVRIAALAFAATAPFIALANDGFYQGAGTDLVPVKSTALRVRRETLVIAPVTPPACADVLFKGKPIQFPPGYFSRPTLSVGGDDSALSLGPPKTCGKEPSMRHSLVAHWRAEAIYTIEALAPATDVLIGFPVPTWEFDFDFNEDGEWKSAPLPAVTRFETFIDGNRVQKVVTRMLEVAGDQKKSTLGFVWSASFPRASGHTLRTVYEFGQSISNGFYEGSEYEGNRPWFLEGWNGSGPGANLLIYYLSPIRTWAEPPPDEITIRVDLPKTLPVTAFVPVHLRPTCVDEHAFHFRFENRFPDKELAISFPVPATGMARFRTPEQWSAWRETLGGDSVRLTCRLKDQLAAKASPALQTILGRVACVRNCGS